MKKLKMSLMTKKSWKVNFIIAVVTLNLLIGINSIGFIVNNEIPSLSFVLVPLWALWALICLYKFITFGKTYKWYRVINDTRKSHGMVNTYARHIGKASDKHVWVKDAKTGTLYLCDEKDVVEETAEYLTKKIEQAALFIAGLTALVILGANVINEGHWVGTVGFAIISFVCFTVYKIQKDEY